MPTYDYECETCGERFEAFQSMSAERLTDCPQEQCDGKVKRLIGTGAGLLFKGSGFYETDYKRSSSSKSWSGGAEGGDTPAGKASGAKGGKSKADKKVGKAKPPKGGDKS